MSAVKGARARSGVQVDDRVEIINGTHVGAQGVVKFIGETQFAKGKWLGVVLDSPDGKNDGTVQGVRYFTCDPDHGLFVKSSMIQLVEEPSSASVSLPPTSPKGSVASPPALGRAPSAATPSARPAVTPATKKPPTVTRPTSSASVRKAPTGAATATPKAAAPRAGVKALPVSKPSTSGTATPSAVEDDEEEEEEPEEKKPTHITVTSPKAAPSPRGAVADSVPHTPQSTHVSTSAVSAATEAELDSLRTECVNLKKELTDARFKLKKAQSAVLELKKSETTANTRLKEAEEKIAQLQDLVESLTLDKDLAEEAAEELKIEMEAMKETVRNLELEVTQAKQNSDVSMQAFMRTLPTDQADVAKIAKQNQSLTDALRQLRDVSMAEKKKFEQHRAHAQSQIEKLQVEAMLAKELKNQTDVQAKQIEDLKARLDDTHNYQQMVEDLSEKNLALEEKIGELEAAVASLQEIKDTADEIEEGHQEYEKQLQNEVDEKTFELQETKQLLRVAEVKNEDLKKTVKQFRMLVQELQQNQQVLQASKGASAEDSEHFSRTFKLQAQLSEMRRQSVEAGLANLKALQCEQQLNFVQAYIPDNLKVDKNSLDMLCLLERLVVKSKLLRKLLTQYYGFEAIVAADGTDSGIKLASVSHKLMLELLQLSCSLGQLSRLMRTSSHDTFNAAAQRWSALQPQERALDELLELVARDAVTEATSVEPVTTTIANVRKYTSMFFESKSDDVLPRVDTGDDVFLSLERMQSYNQGTRAYLRVISGMLTTFKSTEANNEEEKKKIEEATHTYQSLFNQLEDTQIGTVSILNKMLGDATTLAQRRGVVRTSSLVDAIARSDTLAQNVAQEAADLALNVKAAVARADGLRAAEELKRFMTTAVRSEASLFVKVDLLLKTLNQVAAELDEMVKAGKGREDSTQLAAWEAHADHVRAELTEAAGLKSKLEESVEAIQAKTRELFLAQKRARETQAHLDVLQSRLQLVEQKAGSSEELRSELERTKRQDKEFQENLELVQKELDKHAKENKALKQKLAKLSFGSGKTAGRSRGGSSVEGSGAPSGPGIPVSSEEVDLLGRTIRSLRQSLCEARQYKPAQQLAALLPPLPNVKAAQQNEALASQLRHIDASITAIRDASVANLPPHRVDTLLDAARDLTKLNSRMLSLRAGALISDISQEGSSRTSDLYFVQQSQQLKLQAEGRQLHKQLSSFLDSVVGAPAHELRSVPATVPEVTGASSLLGRVVVGPRKAPLPAGPARCLYVNRPQLQTLQALFI